MTEAIWQAVRAAIRAHTGLTLPPSMKSIVTRTVVDLGIDDQANALADAGMRERFLDRVFLGTSWFAREQAGIDALVRSLLALARRRTEPVVTVWSAGCAQGQEPFALAMALVDAGCTPRILATDFHQPSLDVARAASYSPATYQRIPEHWRKKYFEDDREGGYRVVPAIRNCVRFARHNFATDAPITTQLDAVVCRNALIYFERADALTAIARLVSACRDGGFLLLGALEAPLLWMSIGDARFGSGSLPLVELSHTSPLRIPVVATPRTAARLAPVPSSPAVTTALGRSRALERSGQLQEALRVLDQPIVTAPLDAAAHLARGLLLKQLGRLDEAIQELRAARFLDPASWLAPYQLATCLERAGEPEDAIDAYRHTVAAIDAGGKSGLSPPDESVETLAASTAASSRAKLRGARARTHPGIDG